MTDDVVAQAKQALEGVTEGPWRVGKRKWVGVVLTPHGCVWNPNRGEVNNPRDGEFIAQARALVPELVAEVERLRAGGERIVETVEHPGGHPMSAREPVAGWFRETPESLAMLAEERAKLAASETREAVAEALMHWPVGDYQVGGKTAQAMADAAIAAYQAHLTETGHVIVKLPEPSEWVGDDSWPQWNNYPFVRVEPGDEDEDIVLGTNQEHTPYRINPTEAVHVAGSLLAAARLVAAAKAEESE